MPFTQPSKKQMADLVGGDPLSFAFNHQTGDLCIIAPSGKKFRFKQPEAPSVTRRVLFEQDRPSSGRVGESVGGSAKPAPNSPQSPKKAPKTKKSAP